MKISELSRRTGLTVPTIKFYMRQGLLHSGTPVSATQADYDLSHVERLRLVRALVEIARLPISTIHALLDSLGQTPDPDLRVRTQDALRRTHEAIAPAPAADAHRPQRALATVSALGWQVEPDSPVLHELESALIGLESLGLTPREMTLRVYAQAALDAAVAEAAGRPSEPATETVRQVILGTVMTESLLIALRRLAQQHAVSEFSRETRR